MLIGFTPCRCDHRALYSFTGEAITVDVEGAQETYDFTAMPDGKAEAIEAGSLPFRCLLDAERRDGQLTVTLLLTHGYDAPEEVRYPQGPYTLEQAEALLALAYPLEVEPEEEDATPEEGGEEE